MCINLDCLGFTSEIKSKSAFDLMKNVIDEKIVSLLRASMINKSKPNNFCFSMVKYN